MRVETVARAAAHQPKPLVLRGGLARTFGSLACFLSAIFLSLGSYLLVDAFLHPLDAHTLGIVAAAFSITVAVILIFYLVKPHHDGGTGPAHFTREE